MRLYVDFEFTKFNGKLISFAIVTDDGKELYLARPAVELEALKPEMHDFVKSTVLPVLAVEGAVPAYVLLKDWIPQIHRFLVDTLKRDKEIIFVADWPEDIKHLMSLLITGPGTMIGLPSFSCEIYRVESYPCADPAAVAHNALWDARALRLRLTGK